MAIFNERRVHERHLLDLPCLLSLEDDRVPAKVIELKTRDISGGGVFLEMVDEIDIGKTARLDIIIPPALIQCKEGSATHISASGSVVRAESFGVAVSFHEDYRISPLDEVLRTVKAKMNWMARQVCDLGSIDLKNVLHITGREMASECQ